MTTKDKAALPVEVKRGRPRVAYDSTPVSAWVPTSQYDRLCSVAQARNESVSAVVRRLIERSLTPPRSDR